MKLFELDDKWELTVHPEVMTIQCFVDLRDDRKDPILLLKELGFVYFFTDMASDFQDQVDKNKRKEEIKKMVALDEKWEPDDLVKECIRVYAYLSETISSKLLKNVYLMADKISQQLEEINLNERDKSDKPIWDIKKISDTAKGMPSLFESIAKAEQAYIKAQQENDKLRGNKIKTLYEDGFNTKKY